MIAGPLDMTYTEVGRELGEPRSVVKALIAAGRLRRVWDAEAFEWRISRASVDCYHLDQDLDEMAP